MGLAALAIGGLVGAFNGFFVAVRPAAADRRHPVVDVHRPGRHAAGHGQAGRRHPARVLVLPHRRRGPERPAGADRRPRWSRSRSGCWSRTRASASASTRSAATRTRRTPPGWRRARVKFWAYVLAGVFYGAAGAFISAQTGSADPLIGRPLLLQAFAAVVLGGTVLGGGRGGAVGSVVGAYILMIVVNILLVLNVSAYYSSVAEGAILILAVLGGSLTRHSPVADYCQAAGRSSCGRGGRRRRPRRARRAARPAGAGAPRGHGAPASWLERHRATLRYVAAGLSSASRPWWWRPTSSTATRWPTSATTTRCWSCPPSSPSWRSARVRPS